jgi:hypothetical protein
MQHVCGRLLALKYVSNEIIRKRIRILGIFLNKMT